MVELRDVTKRYPGVVANRNVTIRVERGGVHAIVGENGAGKSTLMKILYGLVQPDDGELVVDGAMRRFFSSPAEAIEAGIGMVHQHVKLADNLSVLENVVLGAEPVRAGGRIDLARARLEVTEVAERFGLPLRVDQQVAELGVGIRQRVELVKALYRGATVLILDEPTSLLTPQEAEALLGQVRALCAEGLTVLFISHRLDEVLAVADRITVMRGGRVVADLDPATTTSHALATAMVGSAPVTTPLRQAPALVPGPPELQLDRVGLASSLSRAGLHDVSLTIRPGETVGIAGVEGNGQDELLDVVLGVLKPQEGRIVLHGVDVTGWATRRRRAAGLGCVPQDRQREGVLLDQPLWLSRLLGHQDEPGFARGPWLRRRAVQAAAADVVVGNGVRTPTLDVLASALSGGNQQKFIVGRELAASPRVLLAAQPTRGVDVAAQAAIWTRLNEARAAGLATLLVSADLDELMTLSDRILVLLRGRVVAEVPGPRFDRSELGAAMTGAGGG